MDELKELMEQIEQKRIQEKNDLMKAITQEASTAAFLQTQKMTRMSKLDLNTAAIVETGLPHLRFFEDRLAECESCSTEPRCKGLDRGKYPAAENGRLILKHCERYQELIFKARLQQAGVGRRFLNATLDNYETTTPAQRKALKKAKAYKFENGLLISGPVGTGKTHLAVSILREALKRDMKCSFVEVPALLDSIRSSFKTGKAPRGLDATFLVLDDLGAEKVTDWVKEQLYLIVNERYLSMQPTVITTNCSLEELEANVSQRIVSRILDMTDGILLAGDDYRKKRLKG